MQPTDTENLKSKALSGSIWSLIETFSTQIVQFIVGVILARLLGPGDYGLIALTGIFTAISAAITDAGFEKTLVQKKDLTDIQITTIFYINIFLGLFITVIFIGLAPFIAAFFNEPKLTLILQVVSTGILITAFGQTQQALLIKELQLKKISYAKIASSIVSAATGLLLAYNGFGVWALVFSGLSFQVTNVLFFWIQATWYPQLQFSFASVKSMIPYGMNILASSIFFFLNQQFNNFIVGKFYTKAQLGLFNRGNKFPELIVNIIQSVVLKMSLPLFAKLQDEPARLRDAVKKTDKIIAFVSFPLLILLLVKAEDVTIFLFTEKWRGSIIFLQLFCVVKLFEPFITVQRELLLSQGKAKLLLKIFVATSLIEMALIFAVIKFDILYVVFASLISRAGQYLTYLVIGSKRLEVNWFDEIKWLKPYILITAIMSGVVLATDYALHFSGISIPLFLKLGFELMLGVASYAWLAFKFKIDEVSLVNAAWMMVVKKIKK
ncbi:lipopolysaccharide biosynthesis protein [Ferruginibacter sp. SUN106]|uniref:lipopolysaccharide biosynthesis protein n=1 Tax=Ferruginibacter sp. SUN106 TaxID=2978348 RepID=UPI003D35E62D